MKSLLSYQLARIIRRKDLWGILILVVAGQLLLKTQVTPTLYDLPPNALLVRFLSSGASQEDAFRTCLTGSQMSIGAIYLLLGAAIGGTILCPALRSHAMLPVTAAGYRPRQQSRCCMLLSLMFCTLSILAVWIGEFFLPDSMLAQMARTQPALFLGLELYRLICYLGCAGLGLLLCRLCLRCEVPLVLGSLFLTAETLPTLSRICAILPSGRISPLLFGAAPALSTVHGILESALILLLCFLPLGKEVAP